jgi:hypothetical protein|tara:strand:+ start:3477 stop:3806 length:330 start_codon:yes stop_codon:yes gene_type:complete
MSEYYPNTWVVIKVHVDKSNDPFYKVLAGWSGGYSARHSWRMNSGISSVTKVKDKWHFHGESGSVYICKEDNYGFNLSTSSIYTRLKEQFDEGVIAMPEDTDWINLIGK